MADPGWAGEDDAMEDSYSYSVAWDVDQVDLDFRTGEAGAGDSQYSPSVAELEALLAQRGMDLDLQLFRQTNQVGG